MGKNVQKPSQELCLLLQFLPAPPFGAAMWLLSVPAGWGPSPPSLVLALFFSLVIPPMLPKPLEHHRAHIKHTLFILLGQSAAFHIPPYALSPQICPLPSATLSLSSPSAKSAGKFFWNGLRGCWQDHTSFDPFFFLLCSLAAGNLACKAPGNHSLVCTLQHPSLL